MPVHQLNNGISNKGTKLKTHISSALFIGYTIFLPVPNIMNTAQPTSDTMAVWLKTADQL